MRDFTNIPPISPNVQAHIEWEPRIDKMIQRAANLLGHVSEIEALDKLVGEGATLEEATNAIRAGTILYEAREGVSTVR
jgi:hypothetical protein